MYPPPTHVNMPFYVATYTRAFIHTLTKQGKRESGQKISTVTERRYLTTTREDLSPPSSIRPSMLYIIIFLGPPVKA